MKFKVTYNPDFYHDLIDAVDWYNSKQPGLGNRFYKTIKQQTQKLSVSALHFAVKYDDVRCMCR